MICVICLRNKPDDGNLCCYRTDCRPDAPNAAEKTDGIDPLNTVEPLGP